jgi:hypothetical protein
VRIEVPEDALHTVRVSLKLPGYADLKGCVSGAVQPGVCGPASSHRR